jgi:hypothetical protein
MTDTRRRRPSLARILKIAKRAGCDRVMIDPTGRIVIVMGSGEVQSERNPWDEVLDAADEERSA